MGDLNDDPTNESVKKVLISEKNKDKVALKGIYNPYENYFKDGLGTTAYRDAWSLFDQILITKPLLEKDYSSFQFYKAGIYNKKYLIEKAGPYKGYPKRSWGYGGFSERFSDHLPVYVYVIKEVPSVLSDISPNGREFAGTHIDRLCALVCRRNQANPAIRRVHRERSVHGVCRWLRLR